MNDSPTIRTGPPASPEDALNLLLRSHLTQARSFLIQATSLIGEISESDVAISDGNFDLISTIGDVTVRLSKQGVVHLVQRL